MLPDFKLKLLHSMNTMAEVTTQIIGLQDFVEKQTKNMYYCNTQWMLVFKEIH